MVAKYAVYTALFGGYDVLVEPEGEMSDIDFICFTDQNIESNRWRIVEKDCDGIEPSIRNREFKWQPTKYLKEYEASIYIDANIKVKRDLVVLMEECLAKDSFWACEHPARKTTMMEGLACIVYGKSGFRSTVEQMSTYYVAGFTNAFRLSANYILIRSHLDSQVSERMECVLTQLKKFTGRDQLALPFCAWQASSSYSFLALENMGVDGIFEWIPHKDYAAATVAYKVKRKVKIFLRYLIITIPYFVSLATRMLRHRERHGKRIHPS